jgi:hypothetical protein
MSGGKSREEHHAKASPSGKEAKVRDQEDRTGSERTSRPFQMRWTRDLSLEIRSQVGKM